VTDFGTELRRRREAAGWSQPRLARAVFVTQSFVSKVETGAEVASPEFARASDAALGAGGRLVALVPGRTRAASSDEVEPWELVDLLTASRISAETVRRMRASVDTYTARYPQSDARELFPVVQKQLRRVHESLRHPLSLEAHHEAVRLVAALSGLAGNLALDLHRSEVADQFFAAARLAGDHARDDDIVVWALATGSLAPYYAEDVRRALGMLDRAAALAARASSARRRAWVRALHARAAAAVGEGDVARRALDEARDALDKAGEARPSDFFDEPRLVGLEGATSLLLRDVEQAERLLAASLRARAIGDRKGRALIMCDLASCRLLDGDIAGAGAYLEQALTPDPSVTVTPLLARARAVTADMMAADPRAAREWSDRLARLAATA
jgi:transcriptional regulator with XRE-family HTH domain